MNQKILQCVIITVILGTSLLIGINGCSAAAPTSKIQETDIVVTSSINENHTHQITVKWTDIVYTPSSVTYITTEAGTPYHTHTLRPLKTDFEAIKQGKTVKVTSSMPKPGAVVASNHVHEFVIKK